MGQRADIKEKRPEELRGEIEHTREELTETVSALKKKLSTEHLKQEMKDRVRTATAGKARDTVSRAMDALGVRRSPGGSEDTVRRVKEMAAHSSEKIRQTGTTFTGTLRGNAVSRTILENPVPSVLAGFGIGWLILKGRSGNGREKLAATEWKVAPEGVTRSWSSEVMEKARTRAKETYEGLREKTGDLAGQIRGKTSPHPQRARTSSPDYSSRFRQLLEERPLALLAASFVLGMAAGFSIPETARKDEWMGEAKEAAKEKIVDKAREVAGETAGKAERVAKEAQHSAKDKAREEDIPL